MAWSTSTVKMWVALVMHSLIFLFNVSHIDFSESSAKMIQNTHKVPDEQNRTIETILLCKTRRNIAAMYLCGEVASQHGPPEDCTHVQKKQCAALRGTVHGQNCCTVYNIALE